MPNGPKNLAVRAIRESSGGFLHASCFAHIAVGWNWAFTVATESMIYLSSTNTERVHRHAWPESTSQGVDPGELSPITSASSPP